MIYSLTCIQIEIILVWFWNPDSEDRYRHNNSLVHAAVSQVREEWKHRTRGDEEAYFPRVKRRSTPVARRNSKKFIGASSPRGGRWKWNRWRRRRRTLERWYGRHVAERRLSATGREFVVDRFTMKKSRSISRRLVVTHARARASLGLNTVDVLFHQRRSSDEIDHSKAHSPDAVFFSTFHPTAIYRWKTPRSVSFLTFTTIPG